MTNEVAGYQNDSPVTAFAGIRRQTCLKQMFSGVENETYMKVLEIPEHQKKRYV